MKLTVTSSHLNGTLRIGGSKSHTIRGIVAALSAPGTSTLFNPLDSADTRAALQAARSLGAAVAEFPEAWRITGVGKNCKAPAAPLDLANSGTGTVLLAGFAALQSVPISFTGDASLCSRPMKILDALAQLGVRVTGNGGRVPFTLHGPLAGGFARVDGHSSQYLSSLLFALPQAEHDSVLELDELFERPYVGITTQWLAKLGIEVRSDREMLRWEIPGKQQLRPFERTIPADFSTAAFPLVAGALCGNDLHLTGLDFGDAQGDKQVFDFLHSMGADWHAENGGAVVNAAPLHGARLDLNATPDALPVLAATALFAEGETVLGNVAQARIKETDRIAVMAHELAKLGADVAELSDALVIHGGRSLHGAELSSHGDHRVAMALAVAGLALPPGEELVIRDAECAAVSYPGFFRDFSSLGANFRLG